MDSLEAEGLNEIITDILTDEQIEKDVKSCANDLLDKVEKATKKLYRKRSINKNDWVVTKRKKAHKQGKEHTNGKGKVIAAKKIVSTKDCQNKCKFNCALKIDKETQEKILGDFIKHAFISQASICSSVPGESKRKKSSYSYFLLKEKDSYRLCKNFYLSILAVSQKMVYNVHDKKDKVIGILKADGRGKHKKHHRHHRVTEEQREEVIAHINSFPVVDSHYCRAKTNKKYLEAGLMIEKMYDLYKQTYEKEKNTYVKSSYYRYIFNTSFNINFHVPKTDRCEKCEEVRIKKTEKIPMTDEEKQQHEKLLAEKIAMQEEKKKDKLLNNTKCLLVVFDLENVITLPKAEVGSFFYKRKLTLYNLTAMTSSKQGYCAIWTENSSH